jgi:hypothetical protein
MTTAVTADRYSAINEQFLLESVVEIFGVHDYSYRGELLQRSGMDH